MKITKTYLKQIIKEEIQKIGEAEKPAYSDPFTRLLDQIDVKATANMTPEQKAQYEQKKQESKDHFNKLDAQAKENFKNSLAKAEAEKNENAKMKMYAIIMQLSALAVPSMFYLWKYIAPALALNEDQENS